MSPKRSKPGQIGIVTAAAIAAGSLTSMQLPAYAQSADVTQQAQAGRTANYNIPSQPLAQALTTLGQQAGLQLAVNAPMIVGKTSVAVSGVMTAEEALRQLLAGTGVSYRFTSAFAVTISAESGIGGAMQLDPVQVQGFSVPQQAMIDNLPPPYAGGQVATGSQLGLLGNRSVMDTPFNQTSYTAKKAQDQQARSVRDVLIDDPSARAAGTADGGAGAESVNIRGFYAGGLNAYAYGGLYGILPSWSVMPELAERVEVLKGPSAMLNGMQPDGAIGGAVNVVPKRAPDEPLTQVTANYLSSGQFGGHVDVGRRYGEEKQFGVRFNGVFRAGQTDVRWNSDQRSLGVLGLDFRGERARFSADLGHQYQYVGGVIGYIGIANGVPLPWAPSARSNPTGQPWSSQERSDLFGMFRGEVDLTDRVTAYVAIGAHGNQLGQLIANRSSITNFYGAATANAPYNFQQYNLYRTAEAGVRAHAVTGPIKHELAFTATAYESDTNQGLSLGTPFATNIYNPTITVRPNITPGAVGKVSTSSLSSIGFADTLTAAERRVQLTLGARLQRAAAGNFNPTTGAQLDSYDQSALSPSVALVVKPWENVSIYGNWIQGLQRGSIVPAGFTNAGEVFPPFKSTQFEAGVKIDWGKFTTTASVFQISRPSILTDVVANTQYLGGEQVNQGLEFNFFGEPIAGVRLLGGAMFLNGVLTKTQGGLTDGWVAPAAPALSLNLGGEWDLSFARGLTVNGRVLYTSSQYFDTTFPRRSIPEWTRFDLGARYTFDNPAAKGKSLVARFNVENVLDANYWQGGDNSFVLFLGAPRTFRLSLTADF